MPPRSFAPLAVLQAVALAAVAAACQTAPPYAPRTRDVVITAVPLLTKEMQAIYPFLKQDFAPGGVLAGKEVYAFVPGTVTVMAGDTLRLTLLNPEDDAHTFVLPGLALALPGQSRTDTTYVAPAPGIYPFYCNLPAHAPMMHGELVVLRAGRRGARPPTR
jgi:plastocyanin